MFPIWYFIASANKHQGTDVPRSWVFPRPAHLDSAHPLRIPCRPYFPKIDALFLWQELMPHLRVVFLIMLVALAVRLAAGATLQSRLAGNGAFEFGDSDGYWTLGREIALGQPYQYAGRKVFRMPGYPLLLAGMFRLLGTEIGPLWGRALSAALGAATVAAVIWWAGLLFDAKVAAWTGWCAALYPGAIALGAIVLSEAPFCLLMVLQLALWTRAGRIGERFPLAWHVAAGMAAGAACLMRPSWLLFTPLAILAALLCDWRRRWQDLPGGLAMLLAIAAVLGPWWARNWQITGHFVPTTLQVGASLYDGLNPNADGSSQMSFVDEFAAEQRREDAAPAPPLDDFEYRLDRRLRQAALSWAAEHPGRALQLAGIKLARIWNIWPNEAAFRAWPVRLLAATYLPVLLAGLAGAWRFSGHGFGFVLCWLPAVYFSLLHMIFVGSLRYREPAVLGLMVLAAGTIASWVGRASQPVTAKHGLSGGTST